MLIDSSLKQAPLPEPFSDWSEVEADALEWLAENVVFRGQWCGEAGLRTALPSMAFGTARAAHVYANEPNDRQMAKGHEIRPLIFAARLAADRVYARCAVDDNDPFLDLDIIAHDFGNDVMLAVVSACSGDIRETNAFQTLEAETGLDLDEMVSAWPDEIAWLPPVSAHLALRVPAFIDALKLAGYDAVMIGGCGDNALEPEWHIFDPSIALDAETGLPLPLFQSGEDISASHEGPEP